MQNTSKQSLETRLARNGYIITIVLMISALFTSVLFFILGYLYGSPNLFLPAGLLLATVFFDLLVPLRLLRLGRRDLAMAVLGIAFIINVMAVLPIVQGLGLIIASSIALVVFFIAGLAMSSQFTTLGVITASFFSVAAFVLDSRLGETRLSVPGLEQYTFYIVAFISIPIVFVFIREFNRFNLQAKITLGIIVTGGAAVITISYFALDEMRQITNLLAGRLEGSVRRAAEEQLLNTAALSAENANEFFAEFAYKVEDLAGYRVTLQDKYGILNQGSYWNAAEKMVQLEGGQYGNSAQDISSVFIPSTLPMDESAILGLNTSAYLDFAVPYHLEDNPSILAIYSIDSRGIVRYYPNVNLASLIPPDFDATQRSYYKITAPLFNPERKTRWSIPYVDAAGGGLVVTVAAPVYYRNIFDGILAADIQIAVITEQLSALSVGQTGYAFMVDDAGRLIYMPPDGYEMFDIDPDQLVADDFYKYTILGEGSPELQNFTNRMVAGGNGLGVIEVNGVETYIAFAPVPSNGYSVALVVPTSEMLTSIPASRQETSAQLEAATQTAIIILFATFIGALLISIMLGQLISFPIQSLTKIADKISGGDLTARTEVTTSDETGVLARSFNTMADRLTDTLQGLEDRIAERTRELETVSKSNAYRASLFESIARISRIISSTRQMDRLLPQITETISSQLGYYHVGIFLVDAHKEYAVLAAANSEGGQIMLARNHRLRIGETGIVGYVTQTGTPRIALDVGKDAAYFNNPDLPETHSEIALPLRSGADIMGALDVQSKVINAFNEEDINILSVLADQVSIAIQNARSFNESQEAREQAERSAAQLSEQQWNRFLKKDATPGFHFDGVTIRQVGPALNPQPAQMAIPIILRGVQIGTLKLSASDPNRKWDAHEIAIAEATADRAALAIEAARLLQDAQKRAAKERTIGNISARIGNLVNIDNIVQTTVQELGDTLPGTDVVIQFMSGQIRD